MSLVVGWLLALAVVLAPSAASARETPGLCASAKLALGKDDDLAEATKAAFPLATVTSRDENCVYPLQLLHYGDADVLIASDGNPGEACHGCAATLSAAVLRRLPGQLSVVARFAAFGSHGTFGSPGRITALQLAGHDAFAVESGGTFQGYTSVGVAFYVFHDRRLVGLKPLLPLYANDAGATQGETTQVDGAWHVSSSQPDAVVVDYKVSVGKRTRRASATWVDVADNLVLKAGIVPRELGAAGGQ